MQKISYIAIKEDGKAFRVINSKLLKAACDELPKGKYRLTVEKLRKNKSNPQLAWLFGQVYPLVLKGLNDAGWEFTSIEECDEYCKSMFSSREILNRHTGEILDVPGLKRNMSTVEMMAYVEAIRDWASEYLSINIPDPETNYEMEI